MDVVTISLGLHLIPLPCVLREVARVLKPGGHFIAVIWESLPMLNCCLQTMEDLTHEPGSAFMPLGWTDPLAFAGGRMDPLLQACQLLPAEKHNTVTPLVFNLGPLGGERAWRHGPLAVLPLLERQSAREIQGFKDAFRCRCKTDGLLTDRNDIEFMQCYRMLALRRRE